MRLINTLPAPEPKISGVVIELSLDELKAVRNAMGQTSFGRINTNVGYAGVKQCNLNPTDYDRLFDCLSGLVANHG